MQYRIDHASVGSFNANAPTVASESFNVRSKVVKVEIYIDYYKSRNARVLIDGACEDLQWNGGGSYSDWAPSSRFPYPKGLAQYKLRKRIGELAVQLWAQIFKGDER